MNSDDIKLASQYLKPTLISRPAPADAPVLRSLSPAGGSGGDLKNSAVLSNAVYGADVPQGFERLPQFDRNGPDGFQAAVYRHQESGQLYIAYRGTDELADVSSYKGASQVVQDSGFNRAMDSQVAQGEWLYQDVKKAFPDQDVSLTGHSLGGGVAQVIAAKHGAHAETFEAPGMKHYVERTISSPDTSRINNHYRESDIVPNLTGDHAGTSLVYPSVNETAPFRQPGSPGECKAPEALDFLTSPTLKQPGLIKEKITKEHSMECVQQDILGGAQPKKILGEGEQQLDNWLRPAGGGDPLKDGPTYGNWGGGGYSGGVRDDTPMCRSDWKPPRNKLDEAFRDHDYDYMRHGLGADTPQSNPFKQEADQRLLERLSEIPNSELDLESLRYKLAAQTLFGAKVAGQEVKQGVVDAYDKTKQAANEAWDATKETASEAWDATKDAANEAWDATKETANEAWDATKETANETWDATKDAANDVWDATKDTAGSAWDWAKDKWNNTFGGDDAETGQGPNQVLGYSMQGGGGGRAICEMEDEADDLSGQADDHADRAESAERRARSAARRAASAAARMRAMISRSQR